VSFQLYLAFCAATAALIATPGPVVALVVATSIRRGAKWGLLTVAGTASAMALHLVFVSFGLAAFLARAGTALFWLKWLGAAYLFYLGVKALREPSILDENAAPSLKSPRRIYADGFFTALFNPKPLIFYAAFFPLFISADAPAGPQLALLSITFLVIAGTLDAVWAFAAARARPFAMRAGRWANRVTGGVLIAAAAGLALSRK